MLETLVYIVLAGIICWGLAIATVLIGRRFSKPETDQELLLDRIAW